LVDSRRRLENLGVSLETLIKRTATGDEKVELKRFSSADAAIDYLIAKTREARHRIDQASIDKQRARKTSARISYEKAREETILSNRVQYRYIGILDLDRRFRAIREMLRRGPLSNFYAAFLPQTDEFVPLLNFTIFDREEVVTRAPYDFGEEPVYVAIRNKEIAGLFLAYFDRLWAHCQKIMSEEDIERVLRSSARARCQSIQPSR